MFKYRRLPAIPKKISDIDIENDIRVRIIGKVIDVMPNLIVIDDGSGTAEVLCFETENIDVNDIVRVFARILPLENGFELRGEVIQKMNNLNIPLYKKIFMS